MARIILAPNSTTSASFMIGSPSTGPAILHLNVNEIVDSLPTFPATPPGDGDNSYIQTTVPTGGAKIRFGVPSPTGGAGYTHYLIAYVEYGYRYISAPGALPKIDWKIYHNGDLIIDDGNNTPTFGTNWNQFHDPTGIFGNLLRRPIEFTVTDAESAVWEIEFLPTMAIGGLPPANVRLTSVQLVLHTGYVEVSQGGCVLGGIADLGPERVARVGIKVGGKISIVWNEQPSGGILILPDSNIREFNDATPQIGGGVLMGGVGIDAFFVRKDFLRKTFNINKDLIFTYSGGELNDTPSASLGGDSSPIFIASGLNNLFDDITPAIAIEGQVDYRCFYIFNQHVEETIYNIRSWVTFETDKGSDIKLGIDAKDELQSVVLDSVPDSGYFTVRYEPSNPFGFVPVKVIRPSGLSGDALLTQFAINFQTALRINPDLKDVIVNASTFGSGISFEVLFEELDGKREQENLLIVENTLTPSTIIIIRKVVKGSPINSIAAEINIDVTPPGGVNFSLPNSEFPFVIPKLREGEGFHLWVERTTVPSHEPIANDGFGLGVSIEPVEPVEVG